MNSLWMGNLEPYMDEEFILRAFAQMGETVLKVRLIRDKITGQNAGYGFVELMDETSVERCLRKVNGKPLPFAAPPKRFKLSRATYSKQGESCEMSLRFPPARLSPSSSRTSPQTWTTACCTSSFIIIFPPAAVGRSFWTAGDTPMPCCCLFCRCCGFVSFESEREQKRALAELQGVSGLGRKPLRLSLATKKLNKKESPEHQNCQFHAESYNSHILYLNQYYYPQSTYDWSYDYSYTDPSQSIAQVEEMVEDDGLEYPDCEINVMEVNERFMERSEELYSALMGCFFQPPESWDGVTCSGTCFLPEPVYQYEEMD